MYKYIIKRILFLIPTIIGVSFIIFLIMNITPGDPGRMILGTSASQADVNAYNQMLGYDLPFFEKFIKYIQDVFINFDFGISYVTKQSVFAEIWPRYIITLKLAFIGIVISTLIGVPLGMYSAVKQYSLMDTIPSVIAFFLAAVPTFVLGLVLLFVFSLKLNWLPTYGLTSWENYIMPVLAISIPVAAQNFRFTKSSMLDAIRQDYIRTARAKGAHERSVIWKHALKNALLPVVTQIGMSLGMLLCGAVVAEQVFSVQGIGSLIVERISYKDEPIILAGTILISICFTLVMLIVDVIYAFVDPRIRAKYTKARR
ncbi:MAG: ABC transporter permease [Anaerovoracaceae bacterium]